MDERRSYSEYLKEKFPPKAGFVERMEKREASSFEVVGGRSLRW